MCTICNRQTTTIYSIYGDTFKDIFIVVFLIQIQKPKYSLPRVQKLKALIYYCEIKYVYNHTVIPS
jgi:hypothetical protein